MFNLFFFKTGVDLGGGREDTKKRPVVLAPTRGLVVGLVPPNQEHLQLWDFSRLTSRPLFSNVFFFLFLAYRELLQTGCQASIPKRPLYSELCKGNILIFV